MMRYFHSLTLTLVLVLGPGMSAAQAATISGKVVEPDTRAPVAGATVTVEGSDVEAITDGGGNYSIELPAGTYTLQIEAGEDYEQATVEGVELTADQAVTRELELTRGGGDVAEYGEYTVMSGYLEGSTASVLSEQQVTSGVMEVLGADQMSAAGDSDAADALRRVTGLTIEDGRYVVIRGQPSRYTQTLWNGSPLPSPDPIKRIVPLDLFPTGVLSSISVQKTYDAVYPGSFGGGLVNLNTAGAPEEDFAEISVSLGGNSVSTGESGQTYDGGSDDWLGFDDGTRELGGGLRGSLGNQASTADLESGAKQLDNTWAVEDENLPADVGFGLSGGKTGEAFGGNLGVRAQLNWGRKYRQTERIDRDYALRGDGSLAVRNDQVENRTDMDVNLGGLVAAELAWDDHSVTSNTFLIRKSQQRTEVSEGTRVVSNDLFIRDHLLEWNERELLTQQFLGEHAFDDIELDWRAMFAESSRESPDRRSYTYRRQSNGEFVFFDQGGAQRRWTESEDDITSLGADLTLPVYADETFTVDLGTGVDTYTQDRTSETRRLRLNTTSGADGSQPPEELLAPANIGNTVEVSDDTQTNDRYEGEANVDAIYVRGDVEWGEDLSFNAGIRQESSDFEVSTFRSAGSQGGQQVAGGFDRTDTLPSLGATWRFVEDMQLRASYGSTISRPLLNELSPGRYFDPDSGDEFLGNPELDPAEIDSFDLRWEWYPSAREAITLGVFTKDYTNPIEESFVGVGGSSFLRRVQNADSATVTGVEASARTDLTRIATPLGWEPAWADKVYVQANIAFIDSEVTLASQDLATSGKRALQGQADTVANLQIGYDGGLHDTTVSFNHVGERLQIAGVQGQPDVIQEPVNQLDVNYTYRWSDALELEASVGNLLNEEIELLQGGRVYSSYEKGVDYGVSLKYRF